MQPRLRSRRYTAKVTLPRLHSQGYTAKVGGWGKESGRSPQPGNWFRFCFVFVRASGRGEAAWAPEGDDLPNTGVKAVEMFGSGAGFALFIFAAICMGFKPKFKVIFSKGMLYAWAFRNKRRSLCYMHGL